MDRRTTTLWKNALCTAGIEPLSWGGLEQYQQATCQIFSKRRMVLHLGQEHECCRLYWWRKKIERVGASEYGRWQAEEYLPICNLSMHGLRGAREEAPQPARDIWLMPAGAHINSSRRRSEFLCSCRRRTVFCGQVFVRGSRGRKRTFSWTKAYFTDTDQSDCNIISRDSWRILAWRYGLVCTHYHNFPAINIFVHEIFGLLISMSRLQECTLLGYHAQRKEIL
jgi:hypothetical protein